VVSGLGRQSRICTIAAELKIEDVAYSRVYDAEKSLIFLFELALVEYLHCNDA